MLFINVIYKCYIQLPDSYNIPDTYNYLIHSNGLLFIFSVINAKPDRFFCVFISFGRVAGTLIYVNTSDANVSLDQFTWQEDEIAVTQIIECHVFLGPKSTGVQSGWLAVTSTPHRSNPPQASPTVVLPTVSSSRPSERSAEPQSVEHWVRCGPVQSSSWSRVYRLKVLPQITVIFLFRKSNSSEMGFF